MSRMPGRDIENKHISSFIRRHYLPFPPHRNYQLNLSKKNTTMRVLWLTGLAVTLAHAQQEEHPNARVIYNTRPAAVDDSGLTVAVVPTVLHPASPLLSSFRLKRRGIPTGVTIAADTDYGTTIPICPAAYAPIAGKIKELSDETSHALFTSATISYKDYHLGYAYHATTADSKRDAMAVPNTFEDAVVDKAVADCAARLHAAKVVAGCCCFHYRGKSDWHGYLQLSADPERYPADKANCDV